MLLVLLDTLTFAVEVWPNMLTGRGEDIEGFGGEGEACGKFLPVEIAGNAELVADELIALEG